MCFVMFCCIKFDVVFDFDFVLLRIESRLCITVLLYISMSRVGSVPTQRRVLLRRKTK